MAELFHVFSRPVWRNGVAWRAEMHGRPYTESLWEGWLEFVSLTDGSRISSPRETTQSTSEALAYWAEGLSPVYFDGALERALESTQPTSPQRGTAGA